MSELITRTARLVPYAKRPKQVPSFVTAYSYEPGADDPSMALGNLYIVIEVLVNGRSSEEVAQLVIDAFGEHYYDTNSSSADPLARFEAAVKATNHELGEYVNQGNAAWIGKLSAVVAILAGGQLHLSATGSAEAMLYRGKAATQITGGSANRPTGPSKTFGSIASGELDSGDRLLLATPALIHQVALARLKNIITGATSGGAIAEITELLRGEPSDRIAALVIELTTPEQAALQVRSHEPSEIQLGTPESHLEAAKMAAAPIASATLASTKKVGRVAQSGWEHSQPHARKAGLAVVALTRHVVTGEGAKKRIGIGAGVIAVLVILLIWSQNSSAHTRNLMTRYTNDYHSYQQADAAASRGDKAAAQSQLAELQTELAALTKTAGRSSLDRSLASAKLSAGEPTSVAALAELTSHRLDQVNGLVQVNPTTVASLASLKNASPQHFELSDGKAYLVDAANNSAIYVVNIATGTVKKSSVNTTKLGKVVATTLASNGTGMYLLTNTPAVWFYNFDGDTLAQQAIGIGNWESGTAIASYAGNLYILSDGAVSKHVPTYSGFSPASNYLTAAQVGNAESFAVDGSVYLPSTGSLKQYLSGKLEQTASGAANLSHLTNLRSTAAGDIIIGTDAAAGRVAVWDGHQNLTFSQQFQLSATKHVYDATYDAKTKLVYALVDGRFVSFKLTPSA